MLHSDGEIDAINEACGEARCYNDPAIFTDPRTYGDFLGRLYDCGMLTFLEGEGNGASLGVFCVAKKSGKLRLILTHVN